MRCIFLSILLLGMHAAIAQKKTDDVIHLKNGEAIRGRILADSTLQIKIQTSDGSTWVFRKDEIDFISKEDRFRTFSYKDKGFAHFT